MTTLRMRCAFCTYTIEREFAEFAPPSEAVTWHERMINHLKKEHVRKRKAPVDQEEPK